MPTNSLNLVLLIGRLGADPELSYPAGGEPIARFRVATDRPASGDARPVTDWHDVVCRGKQAEFAGRYLAKGRLVFVRGALAYRASEGRDGRTRRVAAVVASEVRALDHPRPSPGAGAGPDSDDALAV